MLIFAIVASLSFRVLSKTSSIAITQPENVSLPNSTPSLHVAHPGDFLNAERRTLNARL
jgi:hypothetical protein